MGDGKRFERDFVFRHSTLNYVSPVTFEENVL
jgi:hypothetical protein